MHVENVSWSFGPGLYAVIVCIMPLHEPADWIIAQMIKGAAIPVKVAGQNIHA